MILLYYFEQFVSCYGRVWGGCGVWMLQKKYGIQKDLQVHNYNNNR